MSEHGKGGVDVFSIRKQDLCLSTGSLCHKGSEKSHPAWIALLALFNFFFTPVGGLFTEGARSPRLSWSCQSSVYVRYGSPLFFWPLSFSWENIWNICRSISLVESTEFYFKRRFRESTSGVIDEIYKLSMMRSLIAKFSVMCDWYPPLLFATLFQMETNFDFTQC